MHRECKGLSTLCPYEVGNPKITVCDFKGRTSRAVDRDFRRATSAAKTNRDKLGKWARSNRKPAKYPQATMRRRAYVRSLNQISRFYGGGNSDYGAIGNHVQQHQGLQPLPPWVTTNLPTPHAECNVIYSTQIV